MLTKTCRRPCISAMVQKGRRRLAEACIGVLLVGKFFPCLQEARPSLSFNTPYGEAVGLIGTGFVSSIFLCMHYCYNSCTARHDRDSRPNLLPDGRSGRPAFSFSLSVRMSTMTVLLSLATASRAAAGLISPAYPLKAPKKPLRTGGPCSTSESSVQLMIC